MREPLEVQVVQEVTVRTVVKCMLLRPLLHGVHPRSKEAVTTEDVRCAFMSHGIEDEVGHVVLSSATCSGANEKGKYVLCVFVVSVRSCLCLGFVVVFICQISLLRFSCLRPLCLSYRVCSRRVPP